MSDWRGGLVVGTADSHTQFDCEIGGCLWSVNYLRSAQPGLLIQVTASARVKARESLLPGGR